MSTQFKELKRKVLLRMKDKTDGRTLLAVEEAINEAHKAIASVRDFDELVTLDTSHAVTVASQKLYHIETNLALVRPKDIYSIRYMDDANSRKLTYVPPQELDSRIPYTEQLAIGRPTWYTRRGMYLEFIRIPDAAKPLYIQHSQWPATLSGDTDETPYVNKDHVIVALSVDIAYTILDGGSGNWIQRALQLLGVAASEDRARPDVRPVARSFDASASRGPTGEYWKNPFIKENP